MATAAKRASTYATACRLIAAIEPWYDWGKVGVERTESLRPGQIAADGEVRFVELQWLGIHIGFQIGRTPKRRGCS